MWRCFLDLAVSLANPKVSFSQGRILVAAHGGFLVFNSVCRVDFCPLTSLLRAAGSQLSRHAEHRLRPRERSEALQAAGERDAVRGDAAEPVPAQAQLLEQDAAVRPNPPTAQPLATHVTHSRAGRAKTAAIDASVLMMPSTFWSQVQHREERQQLRRRHRTDLHRLHGRVPTHPWTVCHPGLQLVSAVVSCG